MLRIILIVLLLIFVVRALLRLANGVAQGLYGRRGDGVPERGVHMVRDPVCGTYVIPERAVALVEGRREIFFCSAGCRDKYRARPSTPSASSGSPRATSRGEPAKGRTA